MKRNQHLLFLTAWMFLSWTAMQAQALQPEWFKNLDFRFIGPEGNRAIAIAGVPGDPMINYIGAASGGLWKTDDGGVNWRPIFDNQEVSSIGSVALAPSNPNIVWVGTGETFLIRPAHAMGDGIYKSEDAGKTWKKMGLEKTGRIGRIVIHPTNPDIVYAAALGHAYGPQQDRGVYRSTDGGNTWKQVLFVDEGTGAADITIDPQNPDQLYAGMWSIHINTWGLNSGGAGGGVYRSRDGGDTWEPMTTKGLPGGKDRPVGKTAVALCHNQPNVVYALFEIESPALYRSDNGGETWTLMTRNHDIAERAPYYTRIAVAPDNPDEIYFLSVRFAQSLDGGKTLEKNPPRGGGDNHDMWIDPSNPARMMVAHDGCASISLNRGKSFQGVVLPIAQMYHVDVDDRIPYYVYGNRQDGWSYRGPSNSLQGYIPVGLWHGVGGCESGFARPDPNDNNIVWSGCYDGGLERYDLQSQYAREVRVWPEAGYGWAPADMTYRWHWNFPLSFSPHIQNRVYVGSQYVHASDDGGQSWQIISPDLTLNDKTHQQSSGGVATDNLMTFDGCTLFAIEESPLEPGLIWVGSNDGQMNITTDYGKSWTNVTANIKDLPAYGTVSSIQVSRFKKGAAYISVDLHQMGNFDPYVYKTEDYGKSWKLISATVPKSVHSFAHVIKEDPKMEGVLYLGVDNGLYISVDDGANWMQLRNNLPPAPVYWVTVQERFDDLVVATYGRGFYILDNISVIRQYAAEARQKDIHLFGLRPAYRFNDREGIKTDGRSFNSGRNAPYGADISYLLRDSSDAPVSVVITDIEGNPVRTLRAKNTAGIHRIWWDLQYEAPASPKLRTKPAGKDWVGFNEEGWRNLRTWDIDIVDGQRGPRVAPGWYQVTLKVGDRTFVQKLEVLKDPNTNASVGDIKKQVAFALECRDRLNETVGLINSIELLRKELEDQQASQTNAKARTELELLQQQATNIAAQLYDINLTGAREDAFRSPMKVYGRLAAVAADINGSGIDFPPTDQQEGVYEVLSERLETAQTQYEKFVEMNIPAFNKKFGASLGRSLIKP